MNNHGFAAASVAFSILLLSFLFIFSTKISAQEFDGSTMGPPPDGMGGNPPNGEMMAPPDGMGPGNMAPGGMDKAPDLTGVVVADGKVSKDPVTVNGKTISSSSKDQSVLLACNAGVLNASKTLLRKTGDTTNMNNSNFFAQNAAAVASAGSTLTLADVSIDTDSEGSNAVFSTGTGSLVTAKNLVIHTHSNSSRGLDATYNGTVKAENVDITTEGEHCAALATDRGEGTIIVNGGKAQTAGDGSPVIYSTGNITAQKLTGKATGAEIAAIEGKNSITVSDCDLTGSGDHGIMLYQSFSGDAGVGTSVFTSDNCKLTSTKAGPFFYITNTNAKAEVSHSLLIWPDGALIKVCGNDGQRGWGKAGSNGGTFEFSAHDQMLSGEVQCDKISTVKLMLGNAVQYTGAVDVLNQGTVSMSLSKNAEWTLTADSYISVFSDEDMSFSNIKTGGHTVYYDKLQKENKMLKGKTYKLPGGGKLVPVKG